MSLWLWARGRPVWMFPELILGPCSYQKTCRTCRVRVMCPEKQGENSLNIPPIFPVNLKWIAEFAKQRFNDPPLQMKMFDLPPAKHKVTDLKHSKRLWSFSSFLDRKIPWGWNILGQGPQWTPERRFSQIPREIGPESEPWQNQPSGVRFALK